MSDKNGWIDNGVEDCSTTGDWVSQSTGDIVNNGFGEV